MQLLLQLVTLLLVVVPQRLLAFDYADALGKSFLYYEAQRSGHLPPNQRASWRGDSALQDGKAQGVDLVGGYYDAGDNVKFGLPMAFTITMLSWSTIEYRSQLQAEGQLLYALDAIKWGTDYFLKAHTAPFELWGQVGDGRSDHECWQRPEDMTTSRQAYKIDAGNPGSDLAGETAAAMAAAAICFADSDASYSSLLVEHAKQLFEFADKYRGKYDSSIRLAQNFYTSKSGYADELLWAALWLYEATSEERYLDYAMDNAAALGGTLWSIAEFSWDVKYPGVQVLASKILMEGRGGRHTNTLLQYQSKAETFVCAALQKSNGVEIQRTPGGLMFVRSWNNMQYVVTATYLLTVYSDYLSASSRRLQCARGAAEPADLLSFAKSQVDYILGDNPRATSYLIGVGHNYPRQVHHRASSIVSIKVDDAFVSCRGGYNQWYLRNLGDPNVLVGALVGGPDQYDNFADERYNFEQTEPASYNNGPLIGTLARLIGGGASSYRKLPSAGGLYAESKFSAPVLTRPILNDDKVAISQRIVGTWSLKGRKSYKYEVRVENKSEQRMRSLILRIDDLEGPFWGVAKDEEGTFTFPPWMHSLGPRQSFVFVYIQSATQAKVSLESYDVLV